MEQIEINPIDKCDELSERFKEYNPQMFLNTDDGYDWMGDGDKCIVISNPYGGDDIKITIESFGEFTLCFSSGHSHYLNYQYDYDRMIDEVFGILMNTLCSGMITDNDGIWYGSGFFEKERIKDDPQNVFDFVFDIKEFSDHLNKTGYKIEYTFWNPIENTIC